MFENDLEELGRRSAGGKTGEQQVLDETILIRSFKRRLGWLGHQDGSTANIRRRGVALDPGAEVGR